MINLTGIKDEVVFFWNRFANSPPEIMSLSLMVFMLTGVSFLLSWILALVLLLISASLLVWGLNLQANQELEAKQNIKAFYDRREKAAAEAERKRLEASLDGV